MIDRLPTPFGLVRSGVAPDHPEVKSVQNDFTDIANDSRVSFRGNVEVGKDISLDMLRKHYNAVVLAYGSDEDRRLGLDKEETLRHVHSARAFVNWYNGHPDWVDFKPNLDCEDVVIVGQGNVAVDCARILCKTVSELKNTDIAQHALDALSRSKVKRVHVIGRRGHVQAAFTTKELREMTKLEDARLVVDPEELEMGLTKSSEEELAARSGRAAKRQAKILQDAASKSSVSGSSKECHMRFLLSPVALIGEDTIDSVRMSRNRLEGEAGKQNAVSTWCSSWCLSLWCSSCSSSARISVNSFFFSYLNYVHSISRRSHSYDTLEHRYRGNLGHTLWYVASKYRISLCSSG